MTRETILNIALYVGAMTLIVLLLGWGKPSKVLGLFFVSGLAVGSLYALGGIGLGGALPRHRCFEFRQWCRRCGGCHDRVATWTMGGLATHRVALLHPCGPRSFRLPMGVLSRRFWHGENRW